MWLRVQGLLQAVVAPLLLLWGLSAAVGWSRPASTGPVIINEWSQGHGGRKEWVELLVVEGPADLRGWDLGDSSPGDLLFSDNSLWSSVPAGSLVVIYNGGDPDDVLPAQDADLRDDVVVLAHDNADYFSGSWPSLANSTTSDNPHLRNAAAATVHDFTVAPGAVRHPEAYECTYYKGSGIVGVADAAQWANDAPAGSATPGQGNGDVNKAWIEALRAEPAPGAPDLVLHKEGPATAMVGGTLRYRLTISNTGSLTATDVVLTDTLPAALSYAGDDSAWSLQQPAPGVFVWTVGALAPDTRLHVHLSATLDVAMSGALTNTARIRGAPAEADYADNKASAITQVTGDPADGMLIEALLYDGYALWDADEAVRLYNAGVFPVNLAGWQVSDGTTKVSLPSDLQLETGASAWLAQDGAAFQRHFGFAPDAVLSGWPGFANAGDEVFLLRPDGTVADTLVYKLSGEEHEGWQGSAVLPYRAGGLFGEEGQILYRRRDQDSGQPVTDTDTAADWAQTSDDVIEGRKVQYPGWALDAFFFTARLTDTAVLTVAIAPDNAYDAVVKQIAAARQSVQVETLTLENVAVAAALAAAAQRGVTVTVLLEGDPVAGLTNQEKYACQQLEAAGGACWFMARDDLARVHDRYRYLHAKFMIIDGRHALIGSENLSPDSLPHDVKEDGTWGRRGVVLITSAPGVVARAQAVFADDFAPEQHDDLLRWSAANSTYGAPPAGYVPVTATGGVTYTVRYPKPAAFHGTFAFEVVQAPENSLRDRDGLLGLIGRAGAGDTILVQQLSERPHWGPSSSTPVLDPNPRLEAYLDAARRGARVRLLLDRFFDDAGSSVSNRATCDYVNGVARAEGLRLTCALANPTGLGLHNKMVLLHIDGRGWVHVGSINGTEQSNKGNRELALQVQSDGAYALLAEMFAGDWPYRAWLPLATRSYQGPAQHPLISEVLYDPIGPDDVEFIELVNPTSRSVALAGWRLGDATVITDFEDMRLFPAGTELVPGKPLVIATSATAFAATFGHNPDLEIIDSDPAVPDLIDDPAWGDPETFLRLGNEGDEILLWDEGGQLVDVVVYGGGHYQGLVACPLLAAGHSLERFPYWRDQDNCPLDFRDWPLPNPGSLP